MHADVCGPMQRSSPNGFRYYVTFKDYFLGYRAIYFLKSKSDVFDRFKLFICKLKSETNHNIRTLRSDGGGDFLSTEFVNWLTEKCIRHETIVGHTPQQNGVIERDHRTTGEAERSAMLNMKNLPKELWAESYNCAVPYITQVSPVYVQNMSTSNIGHIICFLIFHSEYYFGMFDRLRKNTEPLRC